MAFVRATEHPAGLAQLPEGLRRALRELLRADPRGARELADSVDDPDSPLVELLESAAEAAGWEPNSEEELLQLQDALMDALQENTSLSH